ncbi:hypothetical protein NKH77_03080 [Streptomyces sp. M19]
MREAGHPLRLPVDRAAVMVFVAAHGRVALWHTYPTDEGIRQITAFVDELISLVFA